MANIFWTKNNSIFTPCVETGCLEGTTRSFILENFPVNERRANLPEVQQADEIFLTSAGIGIVKAAGLNEKTLSGDSVIEIKDFFEKAKTQNKKRHET